MGSAILQADKARGFHAIDPDKILPSSIPSDETLVTKRTNISADTGIGLSRQRRTERTTAKHLAVGGFGRRPSYAEHHQEREGDWLVALHGLNLGIRRMKMDYRSGCWSRPYEDCHSDQRVIPLP